MAQLQKVVGVEQKAGLKVFARTEEEGFLRWQGLVTSWMVVKNS